MTVTPVAQLQGVGHGLGEVNQSFVEFAIILVLLDRCLPMSIYDYIKLCLSLSKFSISGLLNWLGL